MTRRRAVLIGYGCPDRGDDAAGPLVARAVRPRLPEGVLAREISGDGFELIEAWSGCDLAVVVDAVVSGAAPGTVLRFDGRRLPPAARVRLASSHALGLREAIELAGVLGRLPRDLVVVGVEARRFEAGAPPGAEVGAAIAAAARAALEEISACTSTV